jgi:hypothetical protein
VLLSFLFGFLEASGRVNLDWLLSTLNIDQRQARLRIAQLCILPQPMSMSLLDRSPTKLRREPSPERGKSHARQQVMKRVLEEMEAVMKRPEKPEKAYICNSDLKSIWFDKSRISALVQPNTLSQHQLDFVQKHMTVILSTLVYVGATDCLSSFASRFFDPLTQQPLLSDADFPFEVSKLNFLDSEPALQKRFYENQFRFRPVIIDLSVSGHTQKVHPKVRLPFETRLKGVGAGGYGKVDCVGISPDYIKLESGFYSPYVGIYQETLRSGTDATTGLQSCMQKN